MFLIIAGSSSMTFLTGSISFDGWLYRCKQDGIRWFPCNDQTNKYHVLCMIFTSDILKWNDIGKLRNYIIKCWM